MEYFQNPPGYYENLEDGEGNPSPIEDMFADLRNFNITPPGQMPESAFNTPPENPATLLLVDQTTRAHPEPMNAHNGFSSHTGQFQEQPLPNPVSVQLPQLDGAQMAGLMTSAMGAAQDALENPASLPLPQLDDAQMAGLMTSAMGAAQDALENSVPHPQLDDAQMADLMTSAMNAAQDAIENPPFQDGISPPAMDYIFGGARVQNIPEMAAELNSTPGFPFAIADPRVQNIPEMGAPSNFAPGMPSNFIDPMQNVPEMVARLQDQQNLPVLAPNGIFTAQNGNGNAAVGDGFQFEGQDFMGIDQEEDEADDDVDYEPNEGEDEEESTESDEDEGQEVICELCNHKFGNKLALQRHQKRVHKTIMDQPDGTFVCEFCNISVMNYTNLCRHINNVHNGKEQHKCEACPVIFSTSRSLALHKSKMHPDLPPELGGPRTKKKRPTNKVFSCELCSYSSAQKHNVTRHFNNVHKKAVQFPCPYKCGRISRSKANMKTHMMTCPQRNALQKR